MVWPENSIPTASESRLEKFAAEHRVRLVYHTNERQGDGDYKQAVILDQDGRRILTNYKAHIAPAEDGTDWYTDQHAVSDGQVVTAYVCYDMHYPDIVTRLRGADSAYATRRCYIWLSAEAVPCCRYSACMRPRRACR